MLGSERDTLLKPTLAAKGTVPALLYTSLPWMRSYMMPYPPRITVLPVPSDIIGEPETRSKVLPGIIHATLGSTADAANADAVQVELLTRKDRIRAGPKSWAVGGNNVVVDGLVRIQSRKLQRWPDCRDRGRSWPSGC